MNAYEQLTKRLELTNARINACHELIASASESGLKLSASSGLGHYLGGDTKDEQVATFVSGMVAALLCHEKYLLAQRFEIIASLVSLAKLEGVAVE